MQHLDSPALRRMFIRAGKMLKEHEPELSAIDSRFGDGDHGVTMRKIAELFLAAAERDGTGDAKSFLGELGDAVMAVNGGSAGPLWGTLIGGLALPLNQGENDLDGARLVAMLEAALQEMMELSTARVGDKTMMDALFPAVDAARAALPADAAKVLAAAARGAEEGRKKTEQFIAKYGRAKSYKEQTLGTADAGATSLALVFQAFAQC